MASTSGRLNADFIRLVYLHATKESKEYLAAIDPIDAEDRDDGDTDGGRRDREFLVQRSRFLSSHPSRTSIARRALFQHQDRNANFALWRTFSLTPSGLA